MPGAGQSTTHSLMNLILVLVGVGIGAAVAVLIDDVIWGVIVGAGFIAISVQMGNWWTRHA